MHIKLNIILLFISLYFIIGCISRNNNDVFSDSPSKRILNAKNELRTLLKSSENGWQVLYSPNKRDNFELYMKFINDVNVEISSDYDQQSTKTIRSTYDISLGATVEIKFDTYNRNIHIFTDSQIRVNQEKYNGYEGSNSFLFIKSSDNGSELEFRANRDQSNSIIFKRWTSTTPPNLADKLKKITDTLEELKKGIVSVKITNQNNINTFQYATFLSAETRNMVAFPFGITNDNKLQSQNIFNVKFAIDDKEIKIFNFRINENTGVTQNITFNLENRTVSDDGLPTYTSELNNGDKAYLYSTKNPLYNTDTHKLLFANRTQKELYYRFNSLSVSNVFKSSSFSKIAGDMIKNSLFNISIRMYFQRTISNVLTNYVFLNGNQSVNNSSIRLLFGVDIKDNYVVFTDKGYSIGRNPTEEAERNLTDFKSLFYAPEGWTAINLGQINTSVTKDSYLLISRKNPAVFFEIYDRLN